MRKYFPHISTFLLTLTLVFVVSGFVLPQIVKAEQVSCQLQGQPTPLAMDRNNCITSGGEVVGTLDDLIEDNNNEPGLLDKIFGFAADALLAPFAWIAIFIVLPIANLIFGLSGILLNQVVLFTIVNMGTNMNAVTVSTAWTAIRDVANMFFIFILLYAAIKTIIGMGSDTKKLIIRVIIVAILINFSLFFTKVVIDVSNILAITFYEAITPTALSEADMLDNGLAGRLKEPFKLGTILDVTPDNVENGIELLDGSRLIIVGILGSIFVLIASFVFFAISIMFIIRFVVLMFVLILSPIAFMSFVLPGIENAWKQWKEALLGQAFFAPIFFLILWIVVKIIDGTVIGDGGSFSDALNSGFGNNENGVVTSITPSSAQVIMDFIIIITLLISALTISKSWSNKAGTAVGNINKWAGKVAGGASFGLLARTGRYTAGAVTEGFKHTGTYKRLESASATSASARLALAAVDKTRKSAFDVRGTKLGGSLSEVLGGAGTATGMGGAEAELNRAREFLERPRTESRKQRLERARKAQAGLDIMAGIEPAAIPIAARTPAQQNAVDAMERAIANASDKEIEVIVESNRRLLQSQEFANALSVRQLDALNKSDKFTETEKGDLKMRRFEAINAALAPGGVVTASVRQNIRRLSDTELEMIDPSYLGNVSFVSHMQPAQIDAVNKSTKFTTAQKSNLRTARRATLFAAVGAGNVPGTQAALRELGHKEIAGLDMPDLLNPTMLQAYIPQMLKRMAPEMNPADITPLRDAIIRAGAPASAWLATPDGQIFS